MRCVAIIPARGGSVGIKNKNLQHVGGLPLVVRAILAAQKATAIDGVFVSTDSENIASVAREYGASIIERPADISGNAAPSESALIHALDEIRKENGVDPEVLAFIQCTSPFVNAADVDGVIELVESNSETDSAFVAVPFHHFLWEEKEGEAKGCNHDGKTRKRRQDMTPQWLEAGSVYAMRVDKFRQENTRFCGRVELYKSDANRCFEIDEPEELEIAQAIAPVIDSASR